MGMVRIAAPGLPTWPRLFFDSANRRAELTAWHPTWQSHERAIRVTVLVGLVTTAFLARCIWQWLPFSDLVDRVYVTIMVTSVAYYLVTFFLHRTLRYFLARRVFATKTVFWFTPQAIAFRSRLYARPIVVWRKWRKQTVRGRFILQPDKGVPDYASSVRARPRVPMEHLQDSMVLEIVLATVDRQRDAIAGGQDAILRAIPITEISQRLATKLTMVCTAAAALTAPVQSARSRTNKAGSDIDAL